MNYKKANVEVVNFSNEDVITLSAIPGHAICATSAAKDLGCGSGLIKKGYCVDEFSGNCKSIFTK